MSRICCINQRVVTGRNGYLGQIISMVKLGQPAGAWWTEMPGGMARVGSNLRGNASI
ncbi:hypothetical protein [Chitinimonas sp. BJB300]|uniref:hypothetical protein n=1 Tax=Chitinimonas sp. BJB300 TaxID=1559339 RepID=UPI001304344B|nr:hypothetical protein [Chitinimonas sp. BJB300]